MRRTPVVLGATAAGLAALFSFHSRSGLAAAPTASTSGTSATSASAKSTPTKPAGGATTKPAGGATTKPAGGATSTTSAPGATTTTAPGGSTTSTTPTTAAPAAHTVTGKLETYGYGQLKVRATMTGGRLTDVKVVTLQTAETYSQQLAAQVIPMLRSQALKAQSARIHGISGASYTSEAFALSLQAALAQLG